VPWTGFELRKLLEKVKPKAGAKFVKFVTAARPDQMPGINRLRGYPWPYTEGLRIEEAMHPLTMLVTGVYGKPLPKQNGAPIRVVVPWKYGYKSGKSLVEIELTDRQPKTLWETLSPEEYPFESNVNPAVPPGGHRRPHPHPAAQRLRGAGGGAIQEVGRRMRPLTFALTAGRPQLAFKKSLFIVTHYCYCIVVRLTEQLTEGFNVEGSTNH
jgi:hypothetical protein